MRGFTLVEVLITVFILSVAAVGVLTMFPAGFQAEKSAKMTNVALYLAQAKIEETISMPYDEISPGTFTEPAGFDPDFPSYRRETKIGLVDPDQDMGDSASDLGIKKIETIVSWESAPEGEVRLFTLISEK